MPIRPENRKLYPANWKVISTSIRERAGYQCEWCPAINGKHHPITGSIVVLTVAHLDHDPRNCDPDNLRALCQKCHNGYDAKRRASDLKSRRHAARAASDLFKETKV
jgi:5-methylcytosine-specific restriction endonuclease McrA